MDRFSRPVPFRPDIAVAVDDTMDRKWDMLDAMESQFYEWLPQLAGEADNVPTAKDVRKKWLRQRWTPLLEKASRLGRPALDRWYGIDSGSVRFAELFEICEYGHIPSETELARLLPFTSGTGG